MGCCWFSPCICPQYQRFAPSEKLQTHQIRQICHSLRRYQSSLPSQRQRLHPDPQQLPKTPKRFPTSGACFVMGQAADASTTIRTSGRLDVPEFLANPALVWESVHQAGESPRGSLVTTDACQLPLGAVIDLRMGFFKTRLDQCIRPTIQQGAVPRLGGPTSGRLCLRSDHRPSLSCHRLARISQCNGVDPCTTRLDLIAPRNSHRCFPGSWHELIAWIRNLWNKENMKIIDRRQT